VNSFILKEVAFDFVAKMLFNKQSGLKHLIYTFLYFFILHLATQFQQLCVALQKNKQLHSDKRLYAIYLKYLTNGKKQLVLCIRSLISDTLDQKM
jgi:hypothetical protein